LHRQDAKDAKRRRPVEGFLASFASWSSDGFAVANAFVSFVWFVDEKIRRTLAAPGMFHR